MTRRTALIALAALALAGCGRKGPLEKPGKDKKNDKDT